MHVLFVYNILVAIGGWPPEGHFTLVLIIHAFSFNIIGNSAGSMGSDVFRIRYIMLLNIIRAILQILLSLVYAQRNTNEN